MDEKKRRPGNLLQRAFFNQYNYILLGSSALFAAATGSWLPAIIGAGAEVLWLVLGADTDVFQRWVGKQETRELRERLVAEQNQMLAALDERYLERWRRLKGTAAEIETLARNNKGLETSLLSDEMAKLGQLLHSFMKMATMHQQLVRYLSENPGVSIERDIAQAKRAMDREEDPRVQASLRQALSLAQKRLRQHLQIEGAWKALTVQMDTLEKSFVYLESHILGIGTREELAKELDGLVMGVATVADLDAETNEVLDNIRGGAAARAGVKAT